MRRPLRSSILLRAPATSASPTRAATGRRRGTRRSNQGRPERDFGSRGGWSGAAPRHPRGPGEHEDLSHTNTRTGKPVTIARALAIGSLVIAVIAVGVLMFGSGGGETYTLHLQNANQLVKGNSVKVGGLDVGKITDITLAQDNQANVKIQVNDEFSPLHEGTTAIIRQASLPSVANRYVALTPGPNNG